MPSVASVNIALQSVKELQLIAKQACDLKAKLGLLYDLRQSGRLDFGALNQEQLDTLNVAEIRDLNSLIDFYEQVRDNFYPLAQLAKGV